MARRRLEILRKIEDVDEMRARDGIFEHVGYEHRVDRRRADVARRFRTKKRAAEYYDEPPRRGPTHGTARRGGARGDESAYGREDHQVVAATGRASSRQDARGAGGAPGGPPDPRPSALGIRDESFDALRENIIRHAVDYLPSPVIHKRYYDAASSSAPPLHLRPPRPPLLPNPTSASPSTSACMPLPSGGGGEPPRATRNPRTSPPRPRRRPQARRRARRDAPTAPGCTEAPPPRRIHRRSRRPP